MLQKRFAAVVAAGVLLSACGSDGGDSEAGMSPAKVNAEFQAAYEAAGLEACDFTDGDGYTSYDFAPCPTNDFEQPAGKVSLHTYRTSDAQEAELSLREADLGLKGWTWGTTTVTLVDLSPTTEVQAQLDEAMDSVGATVAFDNTDYAG